MAPLLVLEVELGPAMLELLDAEEPVAELTVGDTTPLLLLETEPETEPDAELDPATLELLDAEESDAV